MATPYWEHRAALRQAAYDRANNKTVEAVSRAYDRTMRQLDEDINTIIGTYQRKTGLSVREAYDFLREGVPQSVLDDLRSRAAVISDPRQRKRLGVMLRTDAYRARISRLDAIKASTRVGMTEAAEVELRALEPHLRHTADLAYSRTMFDIQKATAGFQMVGVPRKALDTILKSKWSGTHYSTSVWRNRDAMASILDRALMEVSGMGKLSDMTMQDVRGMVDLDKWRRQLTTKFKTEAQYSKYAANRLIRTESAYVAGQTTAVAYEECGIERYEYMATLDSRTSEKCSGLDGKIFEMSEKEVGVNYPPAHPHCRSSVAPVIDGLVREGLTRAARDANGKSVYVPRDMKYQEWKRWQDAGCPDIEKWRADPTAFTKAAEAPVTHGVDGKHYFQRVVGEENPDGTDKFDINEILEAQGFDGVPTVVSQDDYDKLMADGEHPYIGRGYTAPSQEVLDEYKRQLREGEFYVDCSGGAAYGRGMYTASAPANAGNNAKALVDRVAQRYSSTDRGFGQIEKMTLAPNAKIGNYDDIVKEYREALVANKQTIYVPDESLRGKIGEALELARTDPGHARNMLSEIEFEWRSAQPRSMKDEAKQAWRDARRLYLEEYTDVGTMAARLGYDAFDAQLMEDGASYRVILNRSKLIIVE